MGNARIGTIKDKGTPVELCWPSDTKRLAGLCYRGFGAYILFGDLLETSKRGMAWSAKNMVPNNQLLMCLMWYLNFERISLPDAVGTSSIRWSLGRWSNFTNTLQMGCFNHNASIDDIPDIPKLTPKVVVHGPSQKENSSFNYQLLRGKVLWRVSKASRL